MTHAAVSWPTKDANQNSKAERQEHSTAGKTIRLTRHMGEHFPCSGVHVSIQVLGPVPWVHWVWPWRPHHLSTKTIICLNDKMFSPRAKPGSSLGPLGPKAGMRRHACEPTFGPTDSPHRHMQNRSGMLLLCIGQTNLQAVLGQAP